MTTPRQPQLATLRHQLAGIALRLPGPFPYAMSRSDEEHRSPHYRWRADASWGYQGATASTGYSRWRWLAAVKACWNVSLYAFGTHPRFRRWCFVLDNQGRPAFGRWWYDLPWWGEYIPPYQWLHAGYWHRRHAQSVFPRLKAVAPLKQAISIAATYGATFLVSTAEKLWPH